MCLFSIVLPARSTEPNDTAPAVNSDKPLVAMVYDQTCKKWCEKVRPIMQDLRNCYGAQVHFDELDCTPAALQEAKKKAQLLGILPYLSDAADYVPIVLVFDKKRNMVGELCGPKTKADYERSIQKAIPCRDAKRE